jgi:hypothetical protein
MELLFLSFWNQLFELYYLTEQLLKMMKFLQIMFPTENLPDFEAQVALTEQIFCILESAQARSSTILLQLLHQREIPTREREAIRFNPSHVLSRTPTI